MSANLADPHWAFIAPAFLLTVLVLGGLSVTTWLRLRRWEHATRQDAGDAP